MMRKLFEQMKKKIGSGIRKAIFVEKQETYYDDRQAERDELDELLEYIDQHSEEIRLAEERINEQLPYWVCKF